MRNRKRKHGRITALDQIDDCLETETPFQFKFETAGARRRHSALPNPRTQTRTNSQLSFQAESENKRQQSFDSHQHPVKKVWQMRRDDANFKSCLRLSDRSNKYLTESYTVMRASSQNSGHYRHRMRASPHSWFWVSYPETKTKFESGL